MRCIVKKTLTSDEKEGGISDLNVTDAIVGNTPELARVFSGCIDHSQHQGTQVWPRWVDGSQGGLGSGAHVVARSADPPQPRFSQGVGVYSALQVGRLALANHKVGADVGNAGKRKSKVGWSDDGEKSHTIGWHIFIYLKHLSYIEYLLCDIKIMIISQVDYKRGITPAKYE